MVSGRHVQPRSRQLEQRLPERSGKPRVAVRDEGLRKTEMAEDAIHEQPSSLFASDRVWHRSTMHHLAQPTHEHQNAGVAVVVGGKSEDEVKAH
ncbi:hypothetical protein PC116_g20427 [Phytophthora cactorum]|nr:hypothetical protein Pcac1_g21209 [Phytophthora cactorum]KAG4231295.1 hypothetical protein PC116_g20427 [Phytophthora cactorum]